VTGRTRHSPRLLAGRAAVRDRLLVCLGWAQRALRSARTHPSPWEAASDDHFRPIDKIVTESALFALLARRAIGEHAAIDAVMAEVLAADQVLDHTFKLIRWRPHLWCSVGLVWIVLDQFGLGDPQRRSALRALWHDERWGQPGERVPYRLLDQAWARSLARGRRETLLDSMEFLATTSFGNLDNGLFMGVSDLYSLTHAPLYITDFGARGRLLVDKGWVGPLGLSRLLRADFDLSAELAMTELLTQQEPGETYTITLAALTGLFDHFGFLPAPTFRAAEHNTAEDPDDYLLLHSYHSTFVYGLLCALMMELDAITPAVEPLVIAHSPFFPQDWYGDLIPRGTLGQRIVRTAEIWLDLVEVRGGVLVQDSLLRSVGDAYMIDALGGERVEDILALLGMGELLGPSRIDASLRHLVATRLSLADS
jgi:hypothetical protein